MITFELNRDAEVLAWMRQRVPDVPRDAPAIGIADGELICGVAYSDWHYHAGQAFDCRMHIASDSPKWCQRFVLQALFGYPFTQCGVRRVTGVVCKSNKRVRRLIAGDRRSKGLGFVLEGTVRKGWDGRQDACVYGMLREECRWIDGEKVRQRSANPG